MNQNKIVAAAQFARMAHDGQTRKYTLRPYIMHPARVAGRVILLDDVTEDVVCAAWLHDVVEDCNVGKEDLAERFGDDVAELVSELTNPPKGDSSLNRAARKARDRDRLRTASRWARTIKLIDRIDNLGEIGAAPLKFRALYAEESDALREALSGTHCGLEQELRIAINAVPM
jgi:(p)ppGpp synthase/HD superfamily hydrolase